jgi:hypothetical protein
MTDEHVHSHSHPPISGASGELVNLFMELLDRETEFDPHWWYNYGSLTLLRFTAGFFTESMDRATAMGALREVLEQAIDQGQVTEDFLVRSLKHDLDEFVRGKEDPAIYNAHTSRMRKTMQDVIVDPGARARWRRSMAGVDPKYASKTDEELIADARRTLAKSPVTRPLSADEVAGRWAEGTEWWRLSDQLLPESVFEHWSRLNTQRAIEESRRQRP